MRLLPVASTVLLSIAYCLPSRRSAATYSDDFARHVLYPLASAAYVKNPQPCVTSAMNGTVKRVIEVPCDKLKGDTCSGYTVVSNSRKAIALAFRGTDQTRQLIEEFIAAFHKKTPFAGGDVCAYFYEAFIDIWNNGMKDDFLSLYQKNPDFEIWITGHSLGGSVAAVAADYLVTTYRVNPAKIKLVTYGQPRTGDQAYANAHDQRIPYSFRVIHFHDIVPTVPFTAMGYYHHRFEVWYNNSMAHADYRVCAEQEDKSCSDGTLDINELDHHTYFNILDRPNWVAKGCPVRN